MAQPVVPLQVTVLGGVAVHHVGAHHQDVAVPLGGAQPQLVLAALALAVPHALGVDQLVDVVWPDGPPASARRSIRVIVSRLRSAIGASCLVTTPSGGYRLAVEPDAVDAHLLTRAAASAGELGLTELRAVLQEHGAVPFGGLVLPPALEGERRRLVELQLALQDRVAELRAASRGAGAEAADLIGELEALVAAEPLRERRWELLMSALAVGGRRGDALRCYQRARSALVEALGMEPGPGLRELERAVLAAGPAPMANTAVTPHERAPSTRVRLPRARTQFLGRRAELEALDRLLAQRRMVTVVGPGGIGKTRLATETAWRVAGRYRHGVYFCDLASVSDGSALPGVVATAIGARPQGPTTTASVVDALADDHALLVLDNCEHVVADAAALVREVVDGCPKATVLTTSRLRLGQPDEWLFGLDMLDSPTAAELFAARAAEANPALVAGDHGEVVEELCRRLDCMPLAIELAAARMRVLSPAQLLDRLDDRLRLLRADRGSSGRHPTLGATVAWSYGLADEAQREVFDRLGVFRGTFDLDAVLAVCRDLDDDEVTVIDALSGLVDHSLVQCQPGPARYRYRLLETMRQFAADRLAVTGSTARVARRHCDHYARVAREAQADYEGSECARGEARFRAEWDNIRAAFRWALDERDVERLRDLVEAPAWFAYFGLVPEVGEWAEEVITAGIRQPIFFGVASTFAHMAGEHNRATGLADEGVRLAPHPTHPDTQLCHWGAGVAHTHAGRIELVEAAEHRQVAAALAGAQRFSHAVAEGGRAIWAAAACPAEAPAYGARGLALASALGNPAARGAAHLYAGAALRAAGDRDGALEHYRLALADCAASGNHNIEALTMAWMAAQVAPEHRDQTYLKTVRWLREHRDWMGMWICLESLAAHWAGSDPHAAALILGYLEKHDIGHAGVAGRRARALEAVRTAGAGRSLAVGASFARNELVDCVLDKLAVRAN